MKTWPIVILILCLTVVLVPTIAARPAAGAGVPKYDPATEAVFKGTVQEVKDHECPVSGTVGSHVMLKLDETKTIEVHLAPVKFVKMYELTFAPGDQLEVTGSKIMLDGVETIYAREVKRGNDTYTFRDKNGNPVW